MNDPHRMLDWRTCSCAEPGWISTLSCGHEVWTHGPAGGPKPGQWISCNYLPWA